MIRVPRSEASVELIEGTRLVTGTWRKDNNAIAPQSVIHAIAGAGEPALAVSPSTGRG
jgi:hypothetical protein